MGTGDHTGELNETEWCATVLPSLCEWDAKLPFRRSAASMQTTTLVRRPIATSHTGGSSSSKTGRRQLLECSHHLLKGLV